MHTIFVGKKIYYRSMNILHLISTMLSKRQPKIAYGTGDEVDAYIHWVDDSVDVSFVLMNHFSHL